MKKLIVLMFSLLLVFSLAACSQSQNNDETTKIKNKDKDNKVTFYITRHGKTIFNTNDRVQGWSDTPLTEDGIKVAEDLGKGLKVEKVKFDAAYSSDSGRAIETENLVLKNSGQKDVKLNQDKNLREVYFGIFEGDLNGAMWGQIMKTLHQNSMESLMKLGLPKIVDTISAIDETKQAENWQQVSNRFKISIDQIAKKQEKNGGGNVLIVSHGMSINAFISIIAPDQQLDQLENASVTKVEYKDGKYTVKSVNDMSYVKKGQ
ncbi:histidine phosphatase family protein [Heyndrickxia oleronia]|uniref:Phosphoglycerate mutase family protein n=1 Tax=Heyndrickxia oleronia TaxID=38875 RepID=A0AAW6SSZ2_9BACI|nr:histidine phosphatase family protein [Heyndrickxia oleronia]MDH5161405.1 phosphoglycerate mutase family protein [Heyndrickxia oleronia]